MVEIKVVPRRIALALLCGAGLLLLIYMGAVWLRMRFGFDFVFGIAPLFDLDRAPNVPSWFNALLFVAASAASWAGAEGAVPGDRIARIYWYVIGAAMIILSVNEVAALHEPLAQFIAAVTSGGRGFALGWVFVPSAIAVVSALILIPFLTRLPLATSVLLTISGIVYLGGAIALEYVGVKMAEEIAKVPFSDFTEAHWAQVGRNWQYVIEVTVEETLEMCGPILFIYAVLNYLSRTGARLDFVPPIAPGRAAAVSGLLQPRVPPAKGDA